MLVGGLIDKTKRQFQGGCDKCHNRKKKQGVIGILRMERHLLRFTRASAIEEFAFSHIQWDGILIG